MPEVAPTERIAALRRPGEAQLGKGPDVLVDGHKLAAERVEAFDGVRLDGRERRLGGTSARCENDGGENGGLSVSPLVKPRLPLPWIFSSLPVSSIVPSATGPVEATALNVYLRFGSIPTGLYFSIGTPK